MTSERVGRAKAKKARPRRPPERAQLDPGVTATAHDLARAMGGRDTLEPPAGGFFGFVLRPWSATFVDPQMEMAFQDHLFREHIEPSFRRTAVAATLTFAAWGLVDWYVVPEVWPVAALARYAVTVPIYALITLVAFSRHLPRLFDLITWAALLTPNALFLTIGAFASPPGNLLYLMFPVFFLLLIPGLLHAPVTVTFTTGGLTFAGVLFLFLMPSFASEVALFVCAMFAATWGWGSYTHRVQAVGLRRAFWQSQLIGWQRDALQAERERSEALLLNVLPHDIAARLMAGEQTIADSVDEVTVMFADLTQFTGFAARERPQHVVRLLNEIFSSFDGLAAELGVEKIKTIGDCYMAAHGLRGSDDTATPVAELALRMLDALEAVNAEHGERLSLRIGIHTGPVVAGVIGTAKFSYDLWGDTVNIASRMESHGEPGRIHVSEATRAALPQRFVFELRGTIEVKGKGPMRTAFVERDPARSASGSGP